MALHEQFLLGRPQTDEEHMGAAQTDGCRYVILRTRCGVAVSGTDDIQTGMGGGDAFDCQIGDAWFPAVKKNRGFLLRQMG